MGSVEEDLKSISFGKRVAEEEQEALRSYFVETSQWRRIIEGEVDIVYGAKGSGKSAIYSLLVQSGPELARNGVIVRAAEKPQGLPAFAEVVADPPGSEEEWRALWRAYFLCLVAEVLREEEVGTEEAVRVFRGLETEKLISTRGGLAGALNSARAWARQVAQVEGEGGVSADPATGAVSATAKVRLEHGSKNAALRAAIATAGVDLLEAANTALADAGLHVWIALDRLDVAFTDAEDVERDALRALFRVYLDFVGLAQITPKVFLRSDIWDRITTEKGFREGSHITRGERIDWNRDLLLNLVVRRVVENKAVVNRYGIDPETVLGSVAEQEKLFYRIFPEQIESGQNQVATFDWIISRTRDGLGQTVPREIIHLLGTLKVHQLERLEIGHEEPTDNRLFERATFRSAIGPVSESRLKQTLYNESPKLKRNIEALRGGQTSYSLDELREIWSATEEDSRIIADALVGVGFFERRPTNEREFSIPFLYRPGLELNGRSA